jgi:uncharacterized protein YggE
MCVLFLMPKMNNWAADFANTPKLIVRGETSIFKPSDQMEVALGVVTAAENSSQALNENNQRIHQIIENLQALGLNETDYQTGHFHIRPIYQKPAKDSQEDERSKIIRYEVVNAIQLKTQKIELADKIITAAVQGGANQIEQINFNLNNPQAYRIEAIQAAAKNALANANVLADAVGVKLKRVLNLSLDHWQQVPSPMMLRTEAESHHDQNIFEPGKAEIHATVNLTFEIE